MVFVVRDSQAASAFANVVIERAYQARYNNLLDTYKLMTMNAIKSRFSTI